MQSISLSTPKESQKKKYVVLPLSQESSQNFQKKRNTKTPRQTRKNPPESLLLPLLEQVEVVEAVDVDGHLVRRLHDAVKRIAPSLQPCPRDGVTHPHHRRRRDRRPCHSLPADRGAGPPLYDLLLGLGYFDYK